MTENAVYEAMVVDKRSRHPYNNGNSAVIQQVISSRPYSTIVGSSEIMSLDKTVTNNL
jgi:hypothetical protein